VLNKAHAVITNFRQTTKDHTQEPCVEFCVSSLLLSLQISLDIAYKYGPIALQFDLVERVQMERYSGHVRWIIEQLVDNANTHAFSGMDKGAIRVALVDQDDAVVLSVRDSGRGIDPAIQDKVFDPFFSARLGGSVGLGLNMVYRMVTRKLGGRIQLRDAEPHGAHFEIRLPKRVPVDGES
jgi:signal transduction histidine kinase